MPSLTDFSEQDFRSILAGLEERGYRFRRFDRPVDGRDRRVYLRHDVDISPAMALRLGVIERECGVVANFFFQMNAETYSGLAPETLEIVKELLSNGERTAGKIDPGFPRLFDFVKLGAETVDDMRGVCRCTNGNDGFRFRHFGSSGKYGRPAQRMTDQDIGRAVILPHEIRRPQQVRHV